MHQSMIDKVPHQDGHLNAILFPFHTHVGFGIALQSRSLRLDELYLARYLQFDPFVTKAKPKSTVTVTGKHRTSNHFILGVDVSFTPETAPLSIDWLRQDPR